MLNIAMYLRLSIDEENEESLSISNQRNLIQMFIDQHGFNGIIKEFIDDGYSGTTTNRPGFQRMLKEVRNGRISCIIVKDLSRFMRNYIEAGDYLENIFPFLGIRFISVNDNYDSDLYKDSGSSIDVQFKNLIHDYYSKDLSHKAAMSMFQLRKRGKILHTPPYGYKLTEERDGNVIVEENKANIVKEIFSRYIIGDSILNIARDLNARGIVSPGQNRHPNAYSNQAWTKQSVYKILKNSFYIGNYQFNFSGNPLVKCEIHKQGPQCIINHHEQIIEPGIYYQAQKRFYDRYKVRERKRGKIDLPEISKYLYCLDCNRKLSINYYHLDQDPIFFYTCLYCSGKGIKYSKRVSFHHLERYLENSNKEETPQTLKYNSIQIPNKKPVERYLADLYADYKGGKISKSKYLKKKYQIEKETEINFAEPKKNNHVIDEEEINENPKIMRLLISHNGKIKSEIH
ncbi:TPA: recombinase family protein [Streptococcus suis]|nr:recombinase family protein [Streptococcus suis]